MKFLEKGKDGGPESNVTGYWLIEVKWLFSVVLLRFDDGSREAYHDHAFNSVSWLLTGALDEHHKDGRLQWYLPSWRPIRTPRETFHRVFSHGTSWVLSFRGPWLSTWHEWFKGIHTTLTHGRKVVSS